MLVTVSNGQKLKEMKSLQKMVVKDGAQITKHCMKAEECIL